MSSKAALAALIGSVAAQTDCSDAFTKDLDQEILDLQAEKAALEALTAGLEGFKTTDDTNVTTAEGRVTTQVTLMTPFENALATAKSNYKTQFDAKSAATTAETALAGAVTAAGTALTTANTAVTTKSSAITDQDAVIAKLQAAVTDHAAEKVIMQTALTAATTAKTTALTAQTTANTAKTTLETEKTTATTGQDAILTAKTTAESTATTTFNTATTNENDYFTNTYKVAKKAKDVADKKKTYIDAGCTFTGTGSVAFTCVGQTHSPILALKTAADTAATTTNTALNTTVTGPQTKSVKLSWDDFVAALGTAESAKIEATAAKDVAQDNVTTISSAITTATGNVTTANAGVTTTTLAETTAQTNYNTVDGQLTQANLDLARGTAIKTTLSAELVPLVADVAVKAYLKKEQDDKVLVEQGKKATADVRLAEYLALQTMAQESVTRAGLTKTFYEGLVTTAKAAQTLSVNAFNANATAITGKATAITSAQTMLTQSIQDCKLNGYADAQAALKAKLDKEAADVATAATVKSDYDLAAAFNPASPGESNSLCAFPTVAKDAAKEPRPACKEGFCCGAAQKFLKDGTKLSIETCQAELGVHTYQYYPPLPAGAIVEPTPETWRFQCISGAKNLAAAATAALAATYMMA